MIVDEKRQTTVHQIRVFKKFFENVISSEMQLIDCSGRERVWEWVFAPETLPKKHVSSKEASERLKFTRLSGDCKVEIEKIRSSW